jgi:cytosine/adenosine deaminase-related metal-dependent hydrolase
VIGALDECRKNGVTTGCITCNIDSPLEAAADFPIVCVVGPEFVTGSTRMKSGTAQKVDSQYDVHIGDDQNWKGRREPNGEYATLERKAHSTRN